MSPSAHVRFHPPSFLEHPPLSAILANFFRLPTPLLFGRYKYIVPQWVLSLLCYISLFFKKMCHSPKKICQLVKSTFKINPIITINLCSFISFNIFLKLSNVEGWIFWTHLCKATLSLFAFLFSGALLILHRLFYLYSRLFINSFNSFLKKSYTFWQKVFAWFNKVESFYLRFCQMFQVNYFFRFLT